VNKVKLCAIPFSILDIPIIINLTKYNPKYIVNSVVAPRGIGLDGKDIGFVENREELGYNVTSNMEDSITSCDSVLVLEKDRYTPLYDYANNAIDEAIIQRKNIICLLKLKKRELNNYKERCKELNINFTYIVEDKLPLCTYKDISEPLYKPHAPVIFIGELAENVQGYEVFCNLINVCRDKSIKVSAIGSERANGFLELHTIDFSDITGELDKQVYKINKYIKKLEEKEHPGVIIIKLPKPMIKYDDDVRYDFGLSSYLISQAIEGSYFIVCSPYGFFNNEFWNTMSNNFQSKFGYGINAIHMSNKMVDYTDVIDKNDLSFLHIPIYQAEIEIDKYTNESTFISGNLTTSKYMELIVEELYTSLIHAPYEIIM
jgi:peptide maturation system protein (TIGR04066 family)